MRTITITPETAFLYIIGDNAKSGYFAMEIEFHLIFY